MVRLDLVRFGLGWVRFGKVRLDLVRLGNRFCDQEKLSLMGINMSFLSVMRDNPWIEIPEFENVPFHRVLHWEVKGTFLSEFIVNNKKHKGRVRYKEWVNTVERF